MNRYKSQRTPVLSGVPQSSILKAQYFLIFTW